MSTATLPLTFVVPVRTRNVLNAREHWSVRHRRVRNQRRTVAGVLAIEGVLRTPPPLPVVVTLTRLGGRRLDPHDGLPAAMKAVADELAAWLGCDDGDARVAFRYGQGQGPMPGAGGAVEVRVEAAG